MKRFSLVIAATAFAALLFLGTSSETANAKGHTSTTKSSVGNGKGIVGHGHGIGYGRTWRGWTSCCWYPACGCQLYFNPLDGQWYYWCAARGCYLPMAYIGQYPPQPNGPGVPPVGLNGTTPSLPPGAVPLPNNTGPINTPPLNNAPVDPMLQGPR